MKLNAAFLSAGWTVEELHRDYGEDLHVRIFDDGEPTPFRFFVQAKHIHHASRCRSSDGRYVSYPFKRHHMQLWEDFWDPVVLTLWDVEKDRIYWDIAQTLEWPPTDKETRTCLIRFPTDNLLDPDGLARIRSRTIARSQRLEVQLSGVQVLINRICALFDTEIDYDPRAGRLLITLPNGDGDLTFFGWMGEILPELMQRTGLDAATLYMILTEMSLGLMKTAEAGHPFPIIDQNGSLKLLTDPVEVMRHTIREAEASPKRASAAEIAQIIERLNIRP
ncbi:DUF4365 domain-containing protein [Nocardia anaemiae]|uniref:DUF4365 domain-containing protein n=1 Tax=Nocardia anaemiae TaxID=263910 RepID=UPI0007A43E31|nr:DUF4365 domain-containing protein [Nocardia anaemiae]